MKIIAHIDMDAFFASVEELDKPWLVGSPVVIGADPAGGTGRGVVSTANYLARSYGIHSAMPISKAWKLSEEAKKKGLAGAVFLGGNFARYDELSEKINEVIKRISPIVERAGIDESYVDFSSFGSYAHAEKAGAELKALIKKEVGLTASVGIGPNKLIAKIASDLNKPDGLSVIRETDVCSVLAPLSVRKIWGVGPKTEAILHAHRIFTIDDARRFQEVDYRKWLGSFGTIFYRAIFGRDEREFELPAVAKSIGEQETFEIDMNASSKLFPVLDAVGKRVFGKFTESGFEAFKTVVLTVRFSDFQTFTRSRTLRKSVRDGATLSRTVLALFLPFIDSRQNPRKKKIRLLGVRLEKFS